MKKIRLPCLNDPGRLISVHIMHSGLAAAWSAVMVLYELITLDPTDPCYVIPFISRLGVIRSLC
jgi:photosystem II CP47 chlorophyll apoprotein